MNGDYKIGVFRGRETVQVKGSIGGARSVFVKLQGNKNELVYPTLGGNIKNVPANGGKFFAGDLCEYRTDANGVKPEIYMLRTFKVAKTSSTSATLEIERTPYSHTPNVGDKIGKAPSAIGGSVTESTVIAVVAKNNAEQQPIWEVTLGATASFNKGDILVEGDGSAHMLVKNVNAILDCDIDLIDAPATGDEDFDGARYMYVPALGGIMYINKMQVLPKCVLDKNKSNINGWFQVQSV